MYAQVHTYACMHIHTHHTVRMNIIAKFIFQQAAGKYRQQGRNYFVEDGDIIFFKFNAGAGLTSKKK